MKVYSLTDFKGGWFIGNFEPSILKTSNFELGIHRYTAGFEGNPHYHTMSTEYNVIITGKVTIDDIELGPGGIFVYEPYDVSNCQFIEDTILVVARDSSNPKDKFLV